MKRLLWALAAFLVFAPSALADDSSATLGAGGIVLTKSAAIRMASEDLTISPKRVRVRYTFINDSSKDIDTIVAFPLPDVDNYELAETAVGTTTNTTPNFIGFVLKVNGRKLTPHVEEKAIYKDHDVSALVRAQGLPLNIVIGGGYQKLEKLSPAARAALQKADLIEGDPPDPLHAKWTTRTKFWWHQRFPAGKTVTIEHSYQPVTGQTFFSSYALSETESEARYTKDYCLDSATKSAIRAGLDAMKRRSGNDGLFNQYTTDFILVTANNWKGPIGRFHLTVDKLTADNILSLCWDGDLKKISATRFAASRRNFAPQRDVRLLVLETPPAE
jgi:hypothetical protein